MKKNIILKIGMAIIACLLLQNKAFAQLPATITPTMADKPILPSGEPFNTAMIYYCTTDQCMTYTQVIWGISWLGGSPIYVKDEGTGLSATCPPVSAGSPPDVVIGNDLANPGNFIMAVACYDYMGHILVDFYEITGAGTLSLSVSYTGFTSSITIPFTPGTIDFNTVHLDLIADHSILPVLPLCNRFILTTDDQTMHSIYATNGDLTSHTVNPVPLAFSNFTLGSQPDVAAIQRMVSGSPHDIGLIPYVVYPGGTQLWYTELDFTTGTFSSFPHAIDGGANFVVPRIDAIDDYVTNANPLIAQYKIAAAVNPGGFSEIRTYDNHFAMFQSANLLSVGVCSYPLGRLNQYSPVVAVSGPQVYSVYHWTEITSIPPPNDITILDPIDRTVYGTLTPNDYFWVNSVGCAPVTSALVWLPGTWLISTSSCVNYNFNVNAPNLYVWAETTLSGWITKYKLSGSAAFAFREGSISSSVTTVPHNWTLYPNPAIHELNINSTIGNTTATTYHIIDVKGSDVLHGDIAGGNVKIDISQLASGNYLVKLLNESGICGDMKFVKE